MSTAPAVREAATVALLRDGDDGLEVLLLRRHGAHVFGANAHVFPGGAVDAADGAAALAARCDAGIDYAEACLGTTGRAVAYWMAAVRECFEEAGMLVGCHPNGADGRGPPADWAGERDALNAGRRDWPQVVERLDLRFRLDELVYFAIWITPPGPPKRYATRFFAALAPSGQTAMSDGHETTRAWWAQPADALARQARGEIMLMTPTRATLSQLCDYEDAESALAGLVEAGVERQV